MDAPELYDLPALRFASDLRVGITICFDGREGVICSIAGDFISIASRDDDGFQTIERIRLSETRLYPTHPADSERPHAEVLVEARE
jgi:hypothetical protein